MRSFPRKLFFIFILLFGTASFGAMSDVVTIKGVVVNFDQNRVTIGKNSDKEYISVPRSLLPENISPGQKVVFTAKTSSIKLVKKIH